jgi:hypothetical protein
VFFLVFMLRVLLRNQWAAAVAVSLLFGVIDALDSPAPLLEGGTSFIYFMMLTFAVLRWGFTTLSVSALVIQLLLMAPATSDPWTWYSPQTMLLFGTVLAGVTWAFYVSLGRRPANASLFE